jgi:hypothetical protein
VKTMKRPTGKVQRLILDELERAIADKGLHKAFVTSESLAWRLRAINLGIDWQKQDLPEGETPSRSDYVSICRAARELSRTGAVVIDKRTDWRSGDRNRGAHLWIFPAGTKEDGRRPGLAETVSRKVVEILSEALSGDPPRGSKSVGCPAGHVSYRWLRKTLAVAAGDRCGEWRIAKAVERGIDKAEERGTIVVVRQFKHGANGWSDRRVRSFVALSDTTPTKQQTDDP